MDDGVVHIGGLVDHVIGIVLINRGIVQGNAVLLNLIQIGKIALNHGECDRGAETGAGRQSSGVGVGNDFVIFKDVIDHHIIGGVGFFPGGGRLV